jgi:ribosomal protein L4
MLALPLQTRSSAAKYRVEARSLGSKRELVVHVMAQIVLLSVKINRKMRAAALSVVLSRKWQDGEILFVDKLDFAAPKTKDAKAMLIALANASGATTLATKRKNAAVIAFAAKDTVAAKSFRNIGSLITEEVRNLNPVDLMNKKFLIIERPTEALEILTTRLAK